MISPAFSSLVNKEDWVKYILRYFLDQVITLFLKSLSTCMGNFIFLLKLHGKMTDKGLLRLPHSKLPLQKFDNSDPNFTLFLILYWNPMKEHLPWPLCHMFSSLQKPIHNLNIIKVSFFFSVSLKITFF